MLNSTEKLVATDQLKKTKAEHKFCFQFISAETGKRSEAFVTSWDELEKVLKKREDVAGNPSDEDYILLVCVIDGENTRIPPTPIIKVKTFLDISNNEES